jgi:hypothetical protein
MRKYVKKQVKIMFVTLTVLATDSESAGFLARKALRQFKHDELIPCGKSTVIIHDGTLREYSFKTELIK